MRPLLALAALIAVCAAPAGAAAPAPTDAGGAPAYVAADAALPLAGVALVVRAGVDRETATQNGLAALVAEAILRTPVDGVALADAVSAHGGALSYTLSTRTVRFYLEAPPEALAALAPLVARGVSAPAFDAAALAAARTSLGERIAGDARDPVLVGLDAVRSAFYRDAGAWPALGTPAALAALGPADARAFHERWYVRGNAFVTAVGQTGAATDAGSRALVAGLAAGTAPLEPPLTTRPFAKEPRRIVTRRDVFVPYVVLGFGAPALGSADFPAVLVLQSLLGDVFGGESALTPPPLRRPIGTIYGWDVAPAHLALWINGARLDPATGIGAIGAVLKATAQKPLSAAVLDRYKQTARGEWLLAGTTLDERSSAIAAAVTLGIDPRAADAVPAAIAGVTAADVQRVAKAWFASYDVALVLPRGGNGG